MNYRHLFSGLVAAALMATGAGLSASAHASVVIAGTRVIYNATDSEVTLKLSNNGASPSLVQVWLDDGNMMADPAKMNVPFVLTPPVSRIDPAKAQTVRINYTGEPLAQDKETLFWFNELEVPPKPKAEEVGPNYMQLAFRARIKFFYRPANLPIRPETAPEKLTWHAATEGGKPVLQITNPTPYYITVMDATVGEGANAPTFDKGDMVAPGGKLSLPLSAPATAGKVKFNIINDYGGATPYEAVLQ
jgi:chaperone protein EcpD